VNSPAGESVAAAPNRPLSRVVLAILILTPLVSSALSVLLVLIILHFLAGVPGTAVANGTVADPRLLRDFVEPFTQKGTVPVKQYGDVVYYPVPYATPPHLTLTSKSEDRSYAIVRQDEFGFAWALAADLKDLQDVAGKLKDVKDLQDVAGALGNLAGKGLPNLRPGDEFTWEARGVRPFTTQAAMPPYVQKGTFTIPAGGPNEQVEHFPHPFATAPNVMLSFVDSRLVWVSHIKILATTPTGFKWQAVNHSNPSVPQRAAWTAKGVCATPEQVAEFSKNPPLFGKEQVQVIEDKGTFANVPGEQGIQSFTQPFAVPPNVVVPTVIVTEITVQGFKWKHPGTKGANVGLGNQTISWTARGVPDLTVGQKTSNK
jgi:hypothetical protein